MSKKRIFAKIIELPDHQVLLVKEKCEDDEGWEIVQTVDFKGVRASLALGFATEEQADTCFAEYGQEQAQKTLDAILEMMPQ